MAAAQEERFTRKKHDSAYPASAIAYCLGEVNLSLDDVNYVVFYEKPFVKFERLLETYLAHAPQGNVRGEPIVCTPEDAFRCFMGQS